MVAEFDDAAFALAPGQVSDAREDLVRLPRDPTRLEERGDRRSPRPGEGAHSRRASPSARCASSASRRRRRLAEALGKGQSLEEAAKAQGLTVQKSAPIARGGRPPVLSSPALVARVFGLKPGETEKEGFALPQGAAFVSLAEVQPARAPELKDVRDQVRADLVDEGAFAQARAAAAEVKARAETAGPREGGRRGLSRPQGDAGPHRPRAGPRRPRHGGALEEAAFSLPEKATSDPVRTSPGLGGAAGAREEAVRRRRAREAEGPIAASLRQQKRSELFRAFVVAARDRYEITRNAAGLAPRARPGAVGPREERPCTSKSARRRTSSSST